MKTEIFCAIALLCAPCAANAETSFAAIIPLSGNAADQGEWARRGFEIARSDVRESTGFDIKLIYEDSKGGDPATAVQAYKSLQLRAKQPVVFTFGSGVGMALSPLVNSDHVIQMGIATATPKYTSAGDFTFRNFPSATLEGDFLADALINKLRFSRIAVINIENDYGVGSAGALKAAYTRRGGTVVFEESFSPGETDFRPLLLKLKGADSQAVYFAVYPTDGALLLKQARQIGIDRQFIGSVAIAGGKDFFQLSGDAAEGLLVASSLPAAGTEFSKRYDREYPGEAPTQLIYAARAYDAFRIVAAALKICAVSDAECIRDELFKVKNYPGASGTFSFDSSGDISSAFQLFRIHNRAFEALN